MTDAELIAAIAAGQLDALQELHRRHAPWLMVRLAHRTAEQDLVEEAVQDAFVVVWQQAATYRAEGDVAAWIWGIAIRKLIDRLRDLGRLDILKLLHFHLGSQITDIRFIKSGLQEVSRFYVELHKIGVAITHVDVGGGWLIFALPPAEVAVHPGKQNDRHELYLMCEDVRGFIAQMKQRGIACSAVKDEGWGLLTQLTLPGGGKLGVYEPRHARPSPG